MVIHVERRGWHWGWRWLLLGGLLLAGCFPNKCRTERLYQGTSLSEGTIVYGQPPTSHVLTCASVGRPGQKCMQAPDGCIGPSFGCDRDWGDVGCASLSLNVTVAALQNGQVVALPSPDVAVAASLDGLPYTCDAGVGKEELTLVSGTVSVTISLNNFDAHFDMVFTRPNGDSVVIQNGRAALLRALWANVTSCES